MDPNPAFQQLYDKSNEDILISFKDQIYAYACIKRMRKSIRELRDLSNYISCSPEGIALRVCEEVILPYYKSGNKEELGITIDPKSLELFSDRREPSDDTSGDNIAKIRLGKVKNYFTQTSSKVIKILKLKPEFITDSSINIPELTPVEEREKCNIGRFYVSSTYSESIFNLFYESIIEMINDKNFIKLISNFLNFITSDRYTVKAEVIKNNSNYTRELDKLYKSEQILKVLLGRNEHFKKLFNYRANHSRQPEGIIKVIEGRGKEYFTFPGEVDRINSAGDDEVDEDERDNDLSDNTDDEDEPSVRVPVVVISPTEQVYTYTKIETVVPEITSQDINVLNFITDSFDTDGFNDDADIKLYGPEISTVERMIDKLNVDMVSDLGSSSIPKYHKNIIVLMTGILRNKLINKHSNFVKTFNDIGILKVNLYPICHKIFIYCTHFTICSQLYFRPDQALKCGKSFLGGVKSKDYKSNCSIFFEKLGHLLKLIKEDRNFVYFYKVNKKTNKNVLEFKWSDKTHTEKDRGIIFHSTNVDETKVSGYRFDYEVGTNELAKDRGITTQIITSLGEESREVKDRLKNIKNQFLEEFNLTSEKNCPDKMYPSEKYPCY